MIPSCWSKQVQPLPWWDLSDLLSMWCTMHRQVDGRRSSIRHAFYPLWGGASTLVCLCHSAAVFVGCFLMQAFASRCGWTKTLGWIVYQFISLSEFLLVILKPFSKIRKFLTLVIPCDGLHTNPVNYKSGLYTTNNSKYIL